MVPRESSISPVFSTKSRSATGLAEDFQERQGANVKTNDSSCKERGGVEERGGFWLVGKRGRDGRRTSTDGAVTRVVSATRMMTIPFYFPRSFVSLAQAFDFYFSRRSCRLFNPRSLPSPRSLFLPPRGFTTKYRSPPRTEVYLNVFRDLAIHPYCSAFSIGFQFFEGCARGPRRYLFTVMGAVASIRLVKVHRALRERVLLPFFPVLLKFVALQRTCLD